MADILAKDSGIYIAGHQGFVGSAMLRLFIMKRFSDIILKTCHEVDLTQSLMDAFCVIKVEITGKIITSIWNRPIIMEINFFVFNRSPESFHLTPYEFVKEQKTMLCHRTPFELGTYFGVRSS